MSFSTKTIRHVTLLLALVLTGIYGLWFFGVLSFARPTRLLASPSMQDRMDGLILIAEKGPEGAGWRHEVVACLENEENVHVKEMAIIALRELGKSPEAVDSLKEISRLEQDPEIRALLEDLLFQWEVPLPEEAFSPSQGMQSRSEMQGSR
ncbi:MAG: HEAT repeat domain-containing protein [Limisphaerales bacterium]